MTKELEIWLVSMVVVFGLLLGTGQTNGYRDREEDLYFPQHYRKAGRLHRVMFKEQEYLRFSVYWTQKLIWFNYAWYSLLLLIGYRTKFNISDYESYRMVLTVCFFVMVFSTSIIDVLIWIYVRIMRNQ